MTAAIAYGMQTGGRSNSLLALPAEQFEHGDLCSELLSMVNGGLKSRAAKQVLDPLLRMSPENMGQALKRELENISERSNSVVDFDLMGASISETFTGSASELWDVMKVGPRYFQSHGLIEL